MSRNIMRQQVILELEEKARKKKLANFIKKIKEIERLKQEGKYEEPLPPVKQHATAEEILERIEEGRKKRLQDDRNGIRLATEIRKKNERLAAKVYDKPPSEQKDEEPCYLETMYPVEPEILKMLYEGISHNDEGRKRYLTLRRQLDPSERYVYNITHNMDYGWKVEERKYPTNKQFAKYENIKRNFYRRYGIRGETLRNRPAIAMEKPNTILL